MRDNEEPPAVQTGWVGGMDFYLTGRTGWELSAAQARRVYAEKAVMPSANPPIVPTHSSTAPLPALQTHLTRGFSTQTKMPTRSETLPPSSSSSSPSGWRLPPFLFPPAAWLSTLHLIWRHMSATYSRGWIVITTLSAHTHSPPKALNFNYPVSLVIRHQLATTMVIFCQLTSTVAPKRCL